MELPGGPLSNPVSELGSEITFSPSRLPLRVWVHPVPLLARLNPFLTILSEWLPLRFEVASTLEVCQGEPAIVSEISRDEAARLARAGSKVMLLERSIPSAAGVLYLGASARVPSGMAGQTLGETKVSALTDPLPGNSEVLAQRDLEPLWVHSPTGNASLDILSVPIEELANNKPKDTAEFRQHRIHWVPIILWLKSLVDGSSAPTSPLRACFLVEDPNFKRPRYGFLNFAGLVEHAEPNRYHVALGLIPADGVEHDPATVKLLRERSAWVSVITHGNDHRGSEFQSPDEENEAVAVAAQCWLRSRLQESALSMRLGRVMMPAEDSCNLLMMDALARVGFEAVVMELPALAKANATEPWAGTLGFRPYETVRNMPVLNRIPVGPRFKTDAMVASVFEQPVLGWGRQDLFAFGQDLLDEAATFVDTLGDVVWSDIPNLLLSNYRAEQEGSRLKIEMRSRRARLRIPLDVDVISLLRHTTDKPWREPVHIQSPGAGPRILPLSELSSIKVGPDSEIELLALVAQPVASESLPLRANNGLHGLLRKFEETRDRMRPVTARLLGGRRRIRIS